MSMAIIGAVVGVLGTGYGIYSGARQQAKAKKELAKLNATQPIETLPTEIKQNQELASLRSKTGLPSEQYSLAMKNIQRQQAKTLRGATDRRMGLNLLASVDDTAQRAQGDLDVQNAIAREKNERVLMDTNNQVANWKKGIYDRNIRQVWDRNYDYNMGLLGSGNQNVANAIAGGISSLGTLASASASNRDNNNTSWANGLFGRRPNTVNYTGARVNHDRTTGSAAHGW